MLARKRRRLQLCARALSCAQRTIHSLGRKDIGVEEASELHGADMHKNGREEIAHAIQRNIRQHGSSASLGGKADDRAEAPSGGLWRNPGLPALAGCTLAAISSLIKFVGGH